MEYADQNNPTVLKTITVWVVYAVRFVDDSEVIFGICADYDKANEVLDNIPRRHEFYRYALYEREIQTDLEVPNE